ncbi:MAG TPA: hypothetical protein [Caudoviricetes sp.]|nr:MAG TPA: hypothetical protein [Caudoviricetes sp.]
MITRTRAGIILTLSSSSCRIATTISISARWTPRPHSAAYNKPPQEILMSAFNYIWENKEVHDV